MEILVAVVLGCMLVGIFTIPVGIFNTRMFRGVNGSKPSGSEFLKAYTPFANVRFSRVLAYGSSTVYLVALILCAILIMSRVVALILVGLDIGWSVYLFIFTPICVLLAFAIYYILAVVNAIDFGRMIGAGTLTMIMCVIMNPIGYYMLAQQVLPYFKAEENDLSGTFGS